MLHIYILRCSSFMQVKCNWYRMGTILLTVKKNNCKKTKSSTARSCLKFYSSEKLFIESKYKFIGETPNKQHLLQPNLLSNHIEVRNIIVRLSTELQDPKNNFLKEKSPDKLLKNDYISSHTISKRQLLQIFLLIQGWMFDCYDEYLEVFSFAIVHGC